MLARDKYSVPKQIFKNVQTVAPFDVIFPDRYFYSSG
jgi:hypothetical protein